MLGHVVARYLEEQGCRVSTVSARFHAGDVSGFLKEILSDSPGWVVNCAGLRSSDSIDRLNEVNRDLPEMCARLLPPLVRFIHASSDAVFVPEKPARTDRDIPDAEDPYGLSKRLAEIAVKSDRSFVIRCSIIGPELSANRSLLGWFLSQRSVVTGYIDHSWNGITSLEWASLCYRIMTGSQPAASRLIQPGIWPPTTKFDLLCQAGIVWKRNTAVEPVESRNPVHRTLVPNVECADLPMQLARLNRWYRSQ
jgi:dTDP-4-dehydrorhamnose reductase